MLPGALVAMVFGNQIRTATQPGGINCWLVGGVVALVIGLGFAFRKRPVKIFVQ